MKFKIILKKILKIKKTELEKTYDANKDKKK